jgi:HK97 family phage prohead protease
VATDKTNRMTTLVAVPYESPAVVAFRGQTGRETFARGAFDDIGTRACRVNRSHDRGRTIGKVVSFDPTDPRGLVAELRIARTPLGDETLTLAAEGCLSCSIGFSVPTGGEVLDHRTRVRRINRAVVDHISLVEDPAYADAVVLEVG